MPHYNRCWVPNVPANVNEAERDRNPLYHIRTVESSFWANTQLSMSQTRNKMTLGVLLSLASPSTGGSVAGLSLLSRSGTQLNRSQGGQGAVRARSSFNKMVFLGNLMRGSQETFALILPHKDSLTKSCYNNLLAQNIKVGDVIGVFRPKLADEYLGSNANPIQILKDWRNLVILKPNLHLPNLPMVMSGQAHNHIHFIQQGCTVELGNARILHGNDVPCVGTTCDRQNPSCKGCPGIEVRKNYVLQCDVEIANPHAHNPDNGIAHFAIRSWTLTKLVIRNYRMFSRLDPVFMREQENNIEASLQAVANLVNQNGGWTAIGWHKRGVLSAQSDSTQPELSYATKGHLVRLEPTNFPNNQAPALIVAQYTYEP